MVVLLVVVLVVNLALMAVLMVLMMLGMTMMRRAPSCSRAISSRCRRRQPKNSVVGRGHQLASSKQCDGGTGDVPKVRGGWRGKRPQSFEF